MVRQYKSASISTEGKPTEATGVPQAPKTRHSVMDGIVKGVARGMHTPLPDGILPGLSRRVAGGNGMTVAPAATKLPEQSFGGVPYQMGKMGK